MPAPATMSVQEKWQLMRQFDRVLMQQLSATAMPQHFVDRRECAAVASDL